jgi:hypothetical protein
MRKPVLPCSQTGFLGAGGKSLHEVFKGLTRNKFDRLRSFNSYLLPGLRVNPGSGFARSHFESTESDQLNDLGLFYARLNAINNGVHGALSICFATAESLLYGGNEFDFVHLVEK